MEVKYFKIEVTNIFLTKLYNLTDTERVPRIRKWLGREGLQLIKILTTAEQETCETVKGLFDMLGIKFKPQHQETIVLQQYCRLVRHSGESAEEWMRIKNRELNAKNSIEG